MIVAFAGVGASLAAGLQVSSLGSVEGLRLAAAVFGALLGLLGVILAIWHVSKVLAPVTVTFADMKENAQLVERIKEEPTFAGGFEHATVDALLDDYKRAFKAYRSASLRRRAETHEGAKASVTALQAYRSIAEAPPEVVPSKEDVEALEHTFDDLSAVVEFCRSVVMYEKVYTLWKAAQKWVIGAAVIAFIGLALFAWAANPPQAAEKPSGSPHLVR
jgi:hypothetical protein